MQTLFHIHPSPDKVTALVIQHLYAHLGSTTTNTTTSQSTTQQRSVCGIARLLFVLGQTSLCSLVFTEFIAATAKKYPVKDSSTKDVTLPSKESAKDANKGERTGTFKENEVAVDAMEEEMGAAAAADADHERVCKVFTVIPLKLICQCWSQSVGVNSVSFWFICTGVESSD